ncbi:hypothetical protein ACFO6R_06015 [Eubacterium multiforme]|uniref:DNA-binding NarL/FixJ family response regulator n=1 Tax=Eubacterium multiforme TaxID=83339 RepID=A0ABT9US56_9FIRM|nr:hypothetical protein [Eubacterium multiforme]MDQ0149140.1 DNA-binding NarL/FixJ family response regulator [Eubacterium multiforme]
MKNEIKVLKEELERYKKLYIAALIEIENLKSKNNRGAGRKKRFTPMEEEMIKMYRFQGKTIKEIAESFKCSTGLISNIINK